MLKRIVVFGAGGHAKAVIDTLEKQAEYEIVGLLDGGKASGTHVYGYEVLGNEAWLLHNLNSIDGVIVAIGDNWRRGIVAEMIGKAAPELPFVTAIHPSAQVARGARVGAGSVLMAGAVLGSDAEIGEHGVLYPGSSVDHDSRAGRFVSLAPRAVTGGGVTIGDYTAVAIGASIIHGVAIGEHAVIGAGSTVIRDIPSSTVAYGSPARPIRSREKGERYL